MSVYYILRCSYLITTLNAFKLLVKSFTERYIKIEVFREIRGEKLNFYTTKKCYFKLIK